MALILPVLGKMPKNGENCWFAPNATIVGDVTMGKDCTVWFNAVVRGDVNSIIIGDRVNIQDGAVIHCTYQKSKTIIGNNVSIAHNAVVHGCTIEDEVLVGMGAIIMDGAVIGKNSAGVWFYVCMSSHHLLSFLPLIGRWRGASEAARWSS